MYINITISLSEQQFDVSVDDRQRIGDVIRVLKESGKYNGNVDVARFKSVIGETVVDAEQTFSSYGILSGDHLVALE